MEKPKNKLWYHGTREKFEGPLRPLYLSPSKAVANMHGKIYTFTLDSNAKWLDIGEVIYYTPSMDSIGYSAEWPEKLKKKGWDVVWDSEDFARGHEQIFVLNPEILQPVATDLVEAVDGLVKAIINDVLK